MKNTKLDDFEGSNEPQQSAEVITPIYLDALGDSEEQRRIVELAQEQSREPN